MTKRFHSLAHNRIHFTQAIKLLNLQIIAMPYLVLFNFFFLSFEAKVRQEIVIAIGNIVCNFHQRPFYLSITGAKYL